MTTAPLGRPDPLAEIERIYAAQRRNQFSIEATTASERRAKVKRLHAAMFAHREEIQAAMWEDYRKPPAEVDLSEIYPVVGEARHAIRALPRWMKPRRVRGRLALFGASSVVSYEPKGVVLIISPWNFPFNLTFGPLVSAVAAGNCAILKPSELTPASAACMKRIVGELFDESEVAVIEGDAVVGEALLRKKFDHIFFTGSPGVGRIVMKAAAENLTSVTLELGGKSPAFVEGTANVADAAKKIAWGKFFNCGQICVAPDYVLIDERIRAPFTEALLKEIGALGDESRGVIVNEKHAERMRRLFDDAVRRGAQVLFGGHFREREIAPTVLGNVDPDSGVMREEIFGPILPIVSYSSLEEAYAIIRAREKPLVLYVFSRNRATVRRILDATSAGGTVVNHTMIHFYQLNLPFGGVGESGFGRAHGFAGFEAFSNARGIMDQRLPYSAIELLYPPYRGKLKQMLIDFTIRWL